MKRFTIIWVLIFSATISLGTNQILGATEDTTFKSAQSDYTWSFPRDHGSHPQYESEWWYFTGILESSGSTYGYQFTIFRSATNVLPVSNSDWHTNQVYMGHLAISDVKQTNHKSFLRTSRGHPNLANADTTVPGVVQVRDWRLEIGDSWKIQADHEDVELSLSLEPSREMLFQGPNGYSRKGSKPGQASHYYSYTRMNTSGTIATNNIEIQANGKTWFDHEFGSSQLTDEQQGWDWISLRLSDGSDLMIYRLREEDDEITPESSATLRKSDGKVHYLSSNEWSMKPLEYWTSPITEARYPVRWKVILKEPEMELTVNRMFDSQEMIMEGALTAPYWEGLIKANGSFDGGSISGKGFLEMTGYLSSMSGTF